MSRQRITPPKSAVTVKEQENLKTDSVRFALSATDEEASLCYSQQGHARAVKGQANLKVRLVLSAQLVAGAGGRTHGRRKGRKK